MQGQNDPIERNYSYMSLESRRQFLFNVVKDDQCQLTKAFILRALSWEKDPVALWFLVKSVGLMRIDIALSTLLNLCQATDIDMEHTSLHAICAWSLGRIGEPATEAVMKLVASVNLETRRCAVDALGEIRSRTAIPLLISALKQDERPVKFWAGLSLAKIGAPCVPDLKRVAAESEDPTRMIALDALDKIAQAAL